MSVRLRPGVLVASVACLLISAAPVAQRIPGVGRFVVRPPQSGPPSCTTTLSAGATPSQVNNAMSSAADGAVICFSAGNYTWGNGSGARVGQSGFSTSKSVTLICATTPPSSFPWGAASSGGCDVSASGLTFDLPLGVSTSKTYRISGFNFTFNQGTTNFMYMCPGGTCTTTDIRNFRLDHNTFHSTCPGPSGSCGYIVGIHDGNTTANYEGVIDHNRFITDVAVFNQIGALFAFAFNTTTGRLGTGRNLFIEDNSFELTGSAVGEYAAGVGCTDFAAGFAAVFRNNTSENCRFLAHGEDHQLGPGNIEVYRNSFTKKATSDEGTYRTIHMQGGGTGMVWGNTINPNGTVGPFSGVAKDPDAIALLQYRAFKGVPSWCDGTQGVDGNRTPLATYRGYPCYHQSGRDYDGTLRPWYTFRNTWNDLTKVNLVRNGGAACCGATVDYTTLHLVEERDFYNATGAAENSCAGPGQTNCSPFTGATGIGHGPISGRPDACTPNPEGATWAADLGYGGVGYWATDEGEWDSTNGATPDGRLYLCTGTNTWTVMYTPYTYPHPLTN